MCTTIIMADIIFNTLIKVNMISPNVSELKNTLYTN